LKVQQQALDLWIAGVEHCTDSVCCSRSFQLHTCSSFAAAAAAVRTLHSVDIDHAKEEIFMSLPNDVPGMPTEAMLLVDYDKSDVGEFPVCDIHSALAWPAMCAIRSVQQAQKTWHHSMRISYNLLTCPTAAAAAAVSDIKLAVLSAPTAMDKGYDITLHSGQPIKKTSEVRAATAVRATTRAHVGLT
jgi:hypothetical protein